MPEYSIDFAAKLADIAQQIAVDPSDDIEGARSTVYLSRLSMEIALKALLERAGVAVPQIRGRSHNLRALLKDLSGFEVQSEVAAGVTSWVSASRLRAVTIQNGSRSTTVGTVVDAETQGASQYPNEIRYGPSLKDYPPAVVVACASSVVDWAQSNWAMIRERK